MINLGSGLFLIRNSNVLYITGGNSSVVRVVVIWARRRQCYSLILTVFGIITTYIQI
jgi:hypothetical protein